MADSTEIDFDAVFSLLPQELAEDAKNRAKNAELQTAIAGLTPLAWADFGDRFQFLAGGTTDLSTLVVEVISASQTNKKVSLLAHEARNSAVGPGSIVRTDANSLLWYVPLGPHDADSKLRSATRGMFIDQQHFEWALYSSKQSHGLTSAEIRILFQLVQGESPREAAITDGVSFETKRAQIKTASAKLGCAGQSDLVRYALGQMITLYNATSSLAARSSMAEDYVARHLGDDARFSRHPLPNNREMRVLTCGPADGAPIIVFHGMMFPILLRGASPYLDQHGLKLIVPLRSGFLDPKASVDLQHTSDHCDQFFWDFERFLDRNTDLRSASLMGHSFGAVLAVNFLSRGTQSFNRLILASTKLGTAPAERDQISDQFYGGMHNLMRNKKLSRYVSEIFKNYYSNPAIGTKILARLFRGAETDEVLINGTNDVPPLISWFFDLYANSIHGITDDFCFPMKNWWSDLETISIPKLILQGNVDPLISRHTVEHIGQVLGTPQIKFIEGGGHFIAASHPTQFWQSVAERLR